MLSSCYIRCKAGTHRRRSGCCRRLASLAGSIVVLHLREKHRERERERRKRAYCRPAFVQSSTLAQRDKKTQKDRRQVLELALAWSTCYSSSSFFVSSFIAFVLIRHPLLFFPLFYIPICSWVSFFNSVVQPYISFVTTLPLAPLL